MQLIYNLLLQLKNGCVILNIITHRFRLCRSCAERSSAWDDISGGKTKGGKNNGNN